MPEIIDKQVVGIGFGFLNDEEVKKLSVKQITNAYSFDTLRQPVRGGLYDPAFGTLDAHEKCVTCGLTDKYCPGHAGHLQLAVPVYNVFLFPHLYKLLQIKCMHCHKLRLPTLKKKILEAQLVYIQAGHLVKALEIEQTYLAKAAKSASVLSAMTDADEASPDTQSIIDKLDVEIEKANRMAARKRNTQLTMNDVQARNRLIKQFMAAANVKKCCHCSATSPKFRRDGFTKIFVSSSSSAQSANASEGVRLKSVLSEPVPADKSGFSSGKGLEKKLAATKAAAAKAKAKAAAAKSKKAKKGKRGSSDGESGSDSESDDGEADLSVDEAADSDAEEGASPKAGKSAAVAGILADSVAVAETNDSRIMLPNEVERHLQHLWSEEHELLSRLFFAEAKFQVATPAYNAADYRAFFHRVLLVPPSRLRPPRLVGGEAFENEMNTGYRKIFEFNDEILRTVSESTRPAAASASAAAAATSKTAAIKEAAGRATSAAAATTGASIDALADEARNKVIQAWVQLQQQVNLIFDSEKTGSALAKADTTGIKQLLEKKQGLFRKHMMGKRVNFAARSVISPDPYLHTKEIGVPEIFAKTLTYPQPVTPYNVEELRQAIINGPDVHPGANSVIDGRGRRTDLTRMSLVQRTAIAKTLSADSVDSAPITGSVGVEKDLRSDLVGDAGPKVVLRHLKSGDVLLVNRQPTLHKPSMMSHVARVLYGESTIRMHYANCNSYNADFDGDEINLHFPQNELARVEAYDICNNDNQYIVPTSGNPLRGLIQDHVVAGVRLTQRDAFLNREYFQQFLYLGVSDSGLDAPISTPVPTILKPRVLWTGKQVVSCVVGFITHGRPALNLNPVKAKVPGSSWGKAAEEDGFVVVRDNELVQGVIDKAQFGASKYGLVHAVYELYGAKTAGDLLTIFARLFTRILQFDGFTCGMEDMLLLPGADQRRRELIADSAIAGITAAAECAGLTGVNKEDLTDTNAVHLALQRFFRDTANAGELLDGAVKGALNQCTSAIIQACLPGGQRVPFPRNNMAMMTLSGAKGSMVNHSQISCLLGQQELEGRRVPVTQSGKTLPSFAKYDPVPRAGGYISQRFFTGIRPQEYYFHCFAEDHQVLTDRGFLFGPEIERALAAGADIRFASYDPSGKNFRYEPATHFVRRAHDPAREPMVSITHEAEVGRWNGESDATGLYDDRSAGVRRQSNRVSLLVTGEHDLFLQYKPSGHALRVNGEIVPPAKVAASELLRESTPSKSTFKMWGYAENGLVVSDTGAAAQLNQRLGLDSLEKRLAFHALAGYWCGDGTLVGGASPAIVFSPRKHADLVYLRQLVADLGFVADVDTREYVWEKHDRMMLSIVSPVWVAEFFREYGAKYAKPTAGLAVAATAECRPPAGADLKLKSAKWMPSWWKSLTVAEMRAFIAGLRFADGNQPAAAPAVEVSAPARGGGHCIYTSSVLMRDQLVVALLHAGYSAFFTRQHRAGDVASVIDGKPVIAATESWAVHYTDLDRAAAPVMSRSDVKAVAYTGDVWCVTVPPHGLIVTRRARCAPAHGTVLYASRPMIVGNCMAGREGLVDTAVKTSRSGYLQRCLVKHLESLRVGYDQTVRDSDGSVVQFHYGEDSIDITKSSYLNNLSFLAENYKPVVHKLDPTQAMALLDCDSAEQYVNERKALGESIATLKAANTKEFEKEERTLRGDRAASIAPADAAKQAKIALKRQARFEVLSEQEAKFASMVPVESKYAPGATLGAVAERFYSAVDDYVAKDPDATFRQAARAQEAAERALLALEARHTQTVAQAEAAALQASNGSAASNELLARLRAHAAAEEQQIQHLRTVTVNAMTPDKFAYLMNLNFANCLVAPGENVGVLAAQSVGEPSTQMTLNTFHLAGHGGANVTLGIPRLREIIMTASDKMSTPIMEIPLVPGATADAAELLAAKLDRITLTDCVTRIDVRQGIGRTPGSREYRVRVGLKDLKAEWASSRLVTYKQIIRTVASQFSQKLNGVVRQKLRSAVARASTGVTQMTVQNALRDAVDGSEGNDAALDDELASAQERRSAKQAEEGVKDSKRSKKGQEHVSYDDDDEEEEESDADDDNDNEEDGKKAKKEDGDDSGSDDESGSDEEAGEEESKSSRKPSSASKKKAAKGEDESSIAAFINSVAGQWQRHSFIDGMTFDQPTDDASPRWFEARVVTEPGQPKLLMLSLVEKVVAQCIVRQTKGITKAIVLERSVKGVKERYVQTAGVNLRAVMAYPEADVARLKCNDIAALLRTYGVEAARAAIKEEISGVFAVYGIGVDARHLLLIADYMTFWGGYTPMNRMGMDGHVSVLQKATFETSMKFLLDACMRGDTDDCRSPSAAIVLGKPIPSGTSAFGLLQPIAGF